MASWDAPPHLHTQVMGSGTGPGPYVIMPELPELNRKYDHNIGDIVVVGPDGTETHVFPPYQGDLDDPDAAVGAMREILDARFDEDATVTAHESTEGASFGVYHRRWHTYETNQYRLDHLEEEIDAGASAISDQIILAFASGVTGGMAAAVTQEILSRIRQRFKAEPPGHQHDQELFLKHVDALLHRRFGALGQLQYEVISQAGDQLEATVSDERGMVFHVQARSDEAVLTVQIRKSR